MCCCEPRSVASLDRSEGRGIEPSRLNRSLRSLIRRLWQPNHGPPSSECQEDQDASRRGRFAVSENFSDLDRFRGEVNRFAIEMANEQPRGAAILGATFLEYAVKVAICASFQVQDEVSQRAFDGSTPLSRNVVLAYALGIFGTEPTSANIMRSEISTIAKIRNKFAHGMEINSFDAPSVVDLCGNLKLSGEDFQGNYRAQYTASIKVLLSRLDEFIRDHSRQ